MRIKKIWILTMFPDYFSPLREYGVLGATLRNERANDCIQFELSTVRIADYSKKDFKGVDDAPYGGGAGMIMRADILEAAFLEGVVKAGEYKSVKDLHIVCPAPRGKTWCHEDAVSFAKDYLSADCPKDIVFICGRYEGIDERFLCQYVNQFISIGNYIVTGGEIPVMSIIDSAMRFVPGVLGNKLSAVEESFAIPGQIEQPLYTRPREFNGDVVPEVYLSGDPKKIEAYNKEQRREMSKRFRTALF